MSTSNTATEPQGEGKFAPEQNKASSGKKTYAGLFENNRALTEASTLQYIAQPEGDIKLTAD